MRIASPAVPIKYVCFSCTPIIGSLIIYILYIYTLKQINIYIIYIVNGKVRLIYKLYYYENNFIR